MQQIIDVDNNPRLTIDSCYPEMSVIRNFPRNTQQKLCDPVSTRDRIASRVDLTTAVRVGHNIVGEQSEKATHIATATNAEKLVQDVVLMLPGGRIRGTICSQVLTCKESMSSQVEEKIAMLLYWQSYWTVLPMFFVVLCHLSLQLYRFL
jgi:hypothetical protein